MPAFSLTPINAFPQASGTEFPNPLLFSQDDVMFVGPITQVNFVGGTVTERGNGILDVTLGVGGGVTNPANPPNSFQFNDAGVFGGTFGLSWTPEGASDALITFQNFLVNDCALNMTPQSTTWFVIGETDALSKWSAIGTRTYSTVAHPPVGIDFDLNRPGVWVGGPKDNTIPSDPCFDSWLLSDSIYSQVRVTTTTYTHIKLLTRKGSPATPTAFDNAIAVELDGGNYWLPLILQ
jgi:hypothetical protein